MAVTIKRKRLTFEDTFFTSPVLKRRHIIEDGIAMLTAFYHLDIYNPLFVNFNNITRWLNVTDINISNSKIDIFGNKIDYLPRKFGTLVCLQRLNLSRNNLSRFGWSWLNQVFIRKTLLFLDISYNWLPELSEHIWKLSALEELNVSHNILGHLPPGIDKAQNLKILDLSHNKLLYLPIGITYRRIHKLQTLNISMNPLVTAPVKFICDIVRPNIVQIAARRLQQHCRSLGVIFVSDKLNEIVNRNTFENCAYCGEICTTGRAPYVYAARPLVGIIDIAVNLIMQTSKMPVVLYEFCYCFPECKADYE